MLACTEESAKIFDLFHIIYNAIRIGAPIILLIAGMANFANAVINPDKHDTNKALETFKRMTVAAICVFMVPTIISTSLRLLGSKSLNEMLKCSSELFEPGEGSETDPGEDEGGEEETPKPPMEDGGGSDTTIEDPPLNGGNVGDSSYPGNYDNDAGGNGEVNPGEQTHIGPSGSYPLWHDGYCAFEGFAYNDGPEGRNIKIDPAWVKANITSISSDCPEGGWNKKYTVNKGAAENFRQAYDKICQLLTTGIDGYKLKVSDLQNGGTFVQRNTSNGSRSMHAWGLAQDWNYSAKYVINGKTYAPFAGRDKNAYERFVSEGLGGNEKDPRNINYILWLYAYKPSGFTWGGFWGRNGNSSTYDGMHFQIDWKKTC